VEENTSTSVFLMEKVMQEKLKLKNQPMPPNLKITPPNPAGNTTRPGNPLWNEYLDEFGVSTLEKHTPREIWRACRKHYFVSCDTLGNVQCKNCGFGQKIVWGMHKLHKGKIIILNKK
jgi:hypothetical protein